MKHLSLVMLALLILVFCNTSLAATEIAKPAVLDTNSPVHILVVGAGYEEMGLQFQEVALSQAKKLEDSYPGEQILIISAVEGSASEDADHWSSWAPDYKVTSTGRGINARYVVQRLLQFNKIRSLYLIGHSAPALGMGVADANDRINSRTPHITELAGHFTADAIAFLSGCNSGFFMAPQYVSIFHIPVAGSLTSTNFQRLHNNGSFYSEDSGTYPNGNWALQNRLSYASPWQCPGGNCRRMKPDFFPYTGKWGNFTAGLGFYKIFCGGLTADSCDSGYLRLAQGWVGPVHLGEKPSLSEQMNFLSDFFCPQDASGSRHQRCSASLQSFVLNHSVNHSVFDPFSGQSLRCDQASCQVNLRCSDSSCAMSEVLGGPTQTWELEVQNYLRVFAQAQRLN